MARTDNFYTRLAYHAYCTQLGDHSVAWEQLSNAQQLAWESAAKRLCAALIEDIREEITVRLLKKHADPPRIVVDNVLDEW